MSVFYILQFVFAHPEYWISKNTDRCGKTIDDASAGGDGGGMYGQGYNKHYTDNYLSNLISQNTYTLLMPSEKWFITFDNKDVDINNHNVNCQSFRSGNGNLNIEFTIPLNVQSVRYSVAWANNGPNTIQYEEHLVSTTTLPSPPLPDFSPLPSAPPLLSPSPQQISRIKVLCLHGGGGSASSLQQGMQYLVDELSSFEFLFAEAPSSNNLWIQDPPGGKGQPTEDGDWANDSVTYLTNFIHDYGPFQGILGYSQGCAILLVYLSQYPDEFDFAVLFNGYIPTTHDGLTNVINIQAANNAFDRLHALIFIGEQDSTISPHMSVEAAGLFNNPIIVRSSSAGHHPPDENDSTFDTVVDFFVSFSESRPPVCCLAMTPSCLSCSKNITEEEWCNQNTDHSSHHLCSDPLSPPVPAQPPPPPYENVCASTFNFRQTKQFLYSSSDVRCSEFFKDFLHDLKNSSMFLFGDDILCVFVHEIFSPDYILKKNIPVQVFIQHA